MLHQSVQVLVHTCVCSPWHYCKALGSEITISHAFPCHTVVESQHRGFRNTSHYIGVCLTRTLSSNPLIKPPLSSQDSLLLHYIPGNRKVETVYIHSTQPLSRIGMVVDSCDATGCSFQQKSYWSFSFINHGQIENWWLVEKSNVLWRTREWRVRTTT